MRRIALLLAAAALPAAAIAQTAQTARCVPQAQAAALVTFALPTLIEGLAKRCAPGLPQTAYLPRNATALADRYRPEAAAAWPLARTAIAGLFNRFMGQDMPQEMNSELLQTLAEPMLGSLLAERVSIDDCVAADAAIQTVAPLSGRAIGRLAALAATIADRKDKGIAGVLHLCRPEA